MRFRLKKLEPFDPAAQEQGRLPPWGQQTPAGKSLARRLSHKQGPKLGGGG
jgi:hypothetical protein